MSILIRSAVQSDCTKIRPLQKEIADLHHAGRPDLFQTEARYYTEEAFAGIIGAPGHFVFMAENEMGEVVGYTFAWIIDYKNHSTYKPFLCFYIDDICVLESHRRRGIGRMLFEKCKAQAEECGCKMMDLGVWGFNREAIAFYESMGMKERLRKMEYTFE